MGERLLTDIADATGLPAELVSNELDRLITGAGLSTDQVTLEDLRSILAEYVQEILLAARDEHTPTP